MENEKKILGSVGKDETMPPEIIARRNRSLYDLKQKYMAYLFQYNRRGQTANRRRKMLRAMNIIISYAQRAGVPKREFLSNRIGGSNARAPEDLRPPFDG